MDADTTRERIIGICTWDVPGERIPCRYPLLCDRGSRHRCRSTARPCSLSIWRSRSIFRTSRCPCYTRLIRRTDCRRENWSRARWDRGPSWAVSDAQHPRPVRSRTSNRDRNPSSSRRIVYVLLSCKTRRLRSYTEEEEDEKESGMLLAATMASNNRALTWPRDKDPLSSKAPVRYQRLAVRRSFFWRIWCETGICTDLRIRSARVARRTASLAWFLAITAYYVRVKITLITRVKE